MQPIKLLHTADIHIGMENYGRIDPATGINARVMDFLRRLSDIGDYAVEQGVDIFVFAGDAYKTRDPNPTHQREFARRIKKIADAGIPVILLVGNHDLPAVAKRATSIDIFGTLDVPNVYVGNREEVIQVACRRGQPLQVATAPYPLRTALLGKEQAQGKSLSELDTALQNAMIANIGALAAQVGQRPDVPAILVGHFSVNEASHGSEQNIMIGRDAAIPRSILADPAFRYVALGHIHKHQSLNTDLQPPVLYSGSIERIDFGEEHEAKGFVVAEIGDGPTTWEFVRGLPAPGAAVRHRARRCAGRGRSHRGGRGGDQRAARRPVRDGRARRREAAPGSGSARGRAGDHPGAGGRVLRRLAAEGDRADRAPAPGRGLGGGADAGGAAGTVSPGEGGAGRAGKAAVGARRGVDQRGGWGDDGWIGATLRSRIDKRAALQYTHYQDIAIEGGRQAMTVETYISIGQVKRDISELVNRVAYGQEQVVLTSRGKPKAALISIEDFERLHQKPTQATKWADWVARSDALAADILARRNGEPLDIDALMAADRADLEARDDQILGR